MWLNNEMYQEELNDNISRKNIDWKLLQNQTVFITGGTGLIGSSIINTILYANKILKLNCKVIALVRNLENAKLVFKEQLLENLGLELVEGNVCDELKITEKIDFIIHTASQTSSKKFIENSIETIDTSLVGTKNTLELARKNKIKNYVFLSTMEVYGTPHTDEKITEEHGTNLNTMDVRNCYPISKIMAENLCTCYAKKYNFNINVLRLTQTFGSGVSYEDSRVFAEFAKCAIENKDIILHTKGDTKRSYLYTSDAVNAILLVMLKGKEYEIYNVANEKTYCSILEMAELVAEKNDKINVKCVIDENIEKFGYAPTLCMNLSTEKIEKLGWKAQNNLSDMYDKLIGYLKQ